MSSLNPHLAQIAEQLNKGSNRSLRKRVLIFDVETTGLIPKKDPVTKAPPPIETCPYIIQLGFAVYDISLKAVVRQFSSCINIPQTVVIEPFIIELTRVTREKCDAGMLIEDALTEFYNEYRRCDCIVAHNIDFDSEMISLEFHRLNQSILTRCPLYLCLFNETYNRHNNIEMFCTMRSGKNLCNIIVQPPAKLDSLGQEILPKPYKKFPRLEELYFALYQEMPEDLHDALVDSLVCLRCFIKMYLRTDVSSATFRGWLNL
jgi:DNA polymerase III epsilon subunit-like protein